ncbi:SCP-like extracellular [Gloeothece citriformis PCC 7424]|uniref:SCP-like extracellular n=1 Tax=Gloeothece citriformis (strain PCC 7424) TaxID=65393 RepID=B7KJ95_GLOC7|nr:CAP domain-containing protein [Gloeothece citriformis]ACK72179.1 SCP-like extracellular [Gloeothece citriformis PCC 7424]
MKTKLIYGSLLIVSCSILVGGCQSLKDNLPFTSVPQTTPVVLADSNTLTSLEAKIYDQINQYRRSKNLSPLEVNNTIAQQAKIHSERMAAKTVPFSHQGFEERIQKIANTIPYQGAAENIASNQGKSDPAITAVQGWLKSPGHLKNIEGNFNLTGVGVAQNSQGEYYFTQIFINSAAAVNNTTPSPTQVNSSFLGLEEATHQQVNQYRLSKNLPPLLLDASISEEARLFSEKMANGEVPFSHTGFDERVKAIGKSVKFQSVAENLAFNMGFDDPVKVAVGGWIKSPGHEKNMRGDFDLTGIGIAKNNGGEYYFTQLFVKKR